MVAFLRDRVERAVAAGIPPERLIVDPGHDLNKNTLHTLEITRRLEEIVAIGLPTLVAVSNKDFIGESLDREQGYRQNGSLAAAVVCSDEGCADRADARCSRGRGRRAHDGGDSGVPETRVHPP